MNQVSEFRERVVPGEVFGVVMAQHLKRYAFAGLAVEGKRVLDVACGVGYGTHSLADCAQSVVGVDVDAEAIAYALNHYGGKANLVYLQANASRLPFPSGEFDLVTSFETIEHLPDVEGFLNEVQRVLTFDGVFYVSTPAAKVTTSSPPNPHHLQEWRPLDFEQLLRPYFSKIQLYSELVDRKKDQVAAMVRSFDVLNLRKPVPGFVKRTIRSLAFGSTMDAMTVDDVELVPQIDENATHIVAVCSR